MRAGWASVAMADKAVPRRPLLRLGRRTRLSRLEGKSSSAVVEVESSITDPRRGGGSRRAPAARAWKPRLVWFVLGQRIGGFPALQRGWDIERAIVEAIGVAQVLASPRVRAPRSSRVDRWGCGRATGSTCAVPQPPQGAVPRPCVPRRHEYLSGERTGRIEGQAILRERRGRPELLARSNAPGTARRGDRPIRPNPRRRRVDRSGAPARRGRPARRGVRSPPHPSSHEPVISRARDTGVRSDRSGSVPRATVLEPG
jgi:hypothetical protein